MSVKTPLKTDLEVCVSPQNREEYLAEIYRLEGFNGVVEEKTTAYCPVSITLTPSAVKPVIARRQEALKVVLEKAGITMYDPLTSKYSRDLNTEAMPEEVYLADSEILARCRFFVGHHLIASTGFGNECEKARNYNRISVILHDRKIRISRMEPFRTIHLAYDNFEEEADQFIPLFSMLREYEPGLGFNGKKPALLGFHQETKEVVDLEEKVYTEFPHLRYTYDTAADRVEFELQNPGIFYENRK